MTWLNIFVAGFVFSAALYQAVEGKWKWAVALLILAILNFLYGIWSWL